MQQKDTLYGRISRAKLLFLELENHHREFITSGPYEVRRTLSKKHRGSVVYFISKIREPQEEISLLTADILGNLRSSLDYFAYRLVCNGLGKDDGYSYSQFPIGDTEAQYIEMKKDRLKGVVAAAISAIDDLAPYKNGNLNLWTLNKLNNICKHRKLLLEGSALRNIDIGQFMIQKFNDSKPPHIPKTSYPDFSLAIKPEDRLFPLKVGTPLFYDTSGDFNAPSPRFGFEVAIDEKSVTYAMPLLAALRNIIAEGERTFGVLKTYL